MAKRPDVSDHIHPAEAEGAAIVGCSSLRFLPTRPEEVSASYVDRVAAAAQKGGLAAEQADALARGGA